MTARPSNAPTKRPPPIRLLFDELLPWRVAAALRQLKHHVSWVGNEDDGQPARGSGDEDVLDHARRTNQVVVTSNHDMILLCVEQERPAVWIDPRGRQFTRERLALLFLEQVVEWENILAGAGQPIIVHALRTRVDAMTLERAKALAMRRQRALRRKQRTRAARPQPLGPLVP